MGDDYLPREEDIRRPSEEQGHGELVPLPPDIAEPSDDLGDRMLALERRLGQFTTWLIVLIVVIITLGVTAIVALESYVPVVHVAPTQAAPQTPGVSLPPTASSSGGTSSPPVILGVRPVSGPGSGGNKVAVSGQYLQGASSVTFGGLPATAYAINATRTAIIASPPAHIAGTVNVTVTTPKGTSAISVDDEYIYLAPTVIRVNPKTGVGGSTVTIHGKDLTGASVVMFGTTAARSFTVSANGTRITVVAPTLGAGPVSITVTTPGGVSGTSPADVFTYA